MTPPSDAQKVTSALRLGWTIAELRGRSRPGGPVPHDPTHAEIVRRANALPLSVERSLAEQAIENETVLKALASQIGVDFPLGDLSNQPTGIDPTTLASARLTALTKELARAQSANQVQSAWRAITNFLYAWDANIQDTLASGSLAEASAYQLGRGLAETYWALDPSTTEDALSWEVLLGPARHQALTQLVDRLAPYFPPLTPPIISASLTAWTSVAADRSWRARPDASARLFDQLRLWHDLLVTGRDPESMLKPRQVLTHVHQLRPVLRSFWIELTAVVVGVGVLIAGAALLAAGNVNRPLGAAGVILGIFGISGASIAARLKATTQRLIERLRVLLYTEVLTTALTTLPMRPSKPSAGSAHGRRLLPAFDQAALSPATSRR